MKTRLLLLLGIAVTPYALACPLTMFPSALNSSYSEASLMKRSMDPTLLPKLRARKFPLPTALQVVYFQVLLENVDVERAPKINPSKKEFHDRDPNSDYVPYVPAKIDLTIRTLLKPYLESEPKLEYRNDFPYELNSLSKGGSDIVVEIEEKTFHIQINEHWVAGIYEDLALDSTSLLIFPAHFTVNGVSAGVPKGQTPHVPVGVRKLLEDVLPSTYRDNPDAVKNIGSFMVQQSEFDRVYLDFNNDFPEGGDETTFSFVFQSLRGAVRAKVVNGIWQRVKKGKNRVEDGRKRGREGYQSGDQSDGDERSAKKGKKDSEESDVLPNLVHRPKLIDGN
ncbi:hypothetical protein FB446DRAFT_344929 [Lentinula raphanica]|nr:hypothetical protein FB446DRAFT_344929 [Lentinula raphanica]